MSTPTSCVAATLSVLPGCWPQIELDAQETPRGTLFFIQAPGRDHPLMLSHGQLTALVRASGPWLEMFGEDYTPGDCA
jgi:hypothetical protein